MRLYAFPEAQESAEAIAELLRQRQLIEAALRPVSMLPPKAAAASISGAGRMPDDNSGEEQDSAARHRDEWAIAMDFMQKMKFPHEETMQALNQQAVQAADLLSKAHAVAAELARQVGG